MLADAPDPQGESSGVEAPDGRAASLYAAARVPAGWRVRAFDEIPSTNEVIKDALRSGEPEGFCAVALVQNGGYGRQGRSWKSPLGGLYASFALRPAVDPAHVPTLSPVLSVAVCRAIGAVAPVEGLAVKWPNDVLCAQGKLAGISLEALAGGICIGIGINVHPPAVDQAVPGKYRVARLFPDRVGDALSDSQAADLARLFEAVIASVDEAYRTWQEQGFAAFAEEYAQRLCYVGSRVCLETLGGDVLVEGVAAGVDDEGRLLVRTDDGPTVPAASGEVHVSSIG